MATRSVYIDSAREMLHAQSSFSFTPDRDLPPPHGTPVVGLGPRVVFVGFPSDYSLAFLYGLLQLEVIVCGIVTSPGAHPAILGDNALSRIADHLGVPLLRTWRINDDHSRVDLAGLHPEGAIMASFDQIVHAPTLRIPTHGFMNIHPSLLPSYRGPEPVYWAIADGAVESGISLHRAVAKVDAGPILAQRAVPILAGDTSGTLTRRLAGAGLELLGEAVEGLLTDAAGILPDLDAGSYRPSIGHRRLEEAESAVAAERMVRAGVPNMPAWCRIEGRPTYILPASTSATATSCCWRRRPGATAITMSRTVRTARSRRRADRCRGAVAFRRRQPQNARARRYDGGAMGTQEGAHALVVEDDDTVRVFLDRALQRASLTVVGVATGAEAMEQLRNHEEFAIALVDGLLPDTHGLQLTKQFLDEPGAARMAICLLSGTVRRMVPVSAGISALSKPPRLADLLQHIESMLQWRADGSPATARRAALADLESGLLVS